MTEEPGPGSFAGLKDIVATLRGPDGCPWDRQQTHSSLEPYLIEECHEVLQALEDGIPQKLCEELGDLLLQIMLHAQISAEHGEFTSEDVVRTISTKLVHRHPHIFGGPKVQDVAELEHNWEALKQGERPEGESLLSGVPRQMPALIYSHSIQRRAASVGFDWPHKEDIIDKLAEEVDELIRASNKDEKAKEFGDLIFTLVNIARRMDIDLEMALRASNQRFYNRFSRMEKLCHKRGVSFGDLSYDEQNALWNEAKRSADSKL